MTPRNNTREFKATTDGGVKVYSFPTATHSFNLSLYIPAGPLFDEPREAGISHFYEHAVFRNINKLMDYKLYSVLDSLGLTLSGATYNELIQFSVQGAPSHFRQGAEILLLALSPFVISKTELDAERERVKREIREDTYSSSVDAMCQKLVWEGTPLGETITGTVGRVSGFSLNKLRDHAEKITGGENIFFYLTGAIDDGDVEWLVEKVNKIPLPKSEKRENIAKLPPRFFHRSPDLSVKRADYCKVKFAYDVDTTLFPKPVRDLVYDILFQGDTSRVFLELSEKNGYIYSFDANLDEYKNIGSLTLSFETSPAHFLPALQALREIFDGITKDITDSELSLAKVPYLENYLFILDDTESLNWNKAWESHFLGFDYETLEARREAYEKVTVEDVLHCAREIFRPENLSVAVKHKNPDKARAVLQETFFK